MYKYQTTEKLFADMKAFWKDLPEAHFSLKEDNGSISFFSGFSGNKWLSMAMHFKKQVAQATEVEQAEFRAVSSDVAQAVLERIQTHHSNTVAHKAASFIEQQLHSQ